MRTKIRRSLTFANIVSSLALFVALSTGTAYAANTIFSTDIVDGEVRREDLAKNSVNSAKISNGSVSTDDLGVDSVGSDKIAANGVGQSEIATDGVGASEIADGSIDGGEIVDASIGATELGAGSVAASELASNSVDSARIVNGSVDAGDLAGGSSNGAISLNASFAPIGGCNDFNMSVSGAVVGDAVIFSVNGVVPEGILLYGVRVSAAGSVVGKACNFSGVAMAAITNLQVEVITITL